jgi:hypothetical protein
MVKQGLHCTKPARIRGPGFLLILLSGQLLLLGGCAGAPSLNFAGAYFPAWLACSIAALFAAVVARGAMVASGLSIFIPWQLLVCSAIGVMAGLLLWFLWVAR